MDLERQRSQSQHQGTLKNSLSGESAFDLPIAFTLRDLACFDPVLAPQYEWSPISSSAAKAKYESLSFSVEEHPLYYLRDP